MRRAVMPVVSAVLVVAGVACGGSSSNNNSPSPNNIKASPAQSLSEVAASIVSGAMNNSVGSALGWNGPPRPAPSPLQRLWDELNPLRSAYAASLSCSGQMLLPAFAGVGAYTFTPAHCRVTWTNDKLASSVWSGTFNVVYAGSCDTTNAIILNQTAACTLTRTTAAGGNTRTVAGPLGDDYSITHNTNGAGTGWDTMVSPAPTDAGVIVTCGAGGCATAGGTVEISGSHLTGTVTPSGGSTTKIWDHTGTTPTPLTCTAGRVLSGTVAVQDNLAKFTATATLKGVTFPSLGCCYPNAGTITTVVQGGTETMNFGATCGEVTLTTANGATESVTLRHCL